MSEVLLGLLGDVLVDRDDPAEVFRNVRDIMRAPSILFGNLEGVYTDDPRIAPDALGTVCPRAHNLDVYPQVGFNVMSMANNHVLDAGPEAMLQTRARLRSHGVQTCGAGESLADARKPAILSAGGIRVAFLAYASVFPVGHEAGADRPGLMAMRAYNRWQEAFPSMYAPGMQPVVTTVPDESDLARLTEDLASARQYADLVVVSFHWGDYTCPYHLTDHETRTARFCIDHGADLVVGHHHHALRGMEWYRGKPILYGLGHFVFDYRARISERDFRKKIAQWDPAGVLKRTLYAPGPRAGWPLLPLHEDTRMTVLAWAAADRTGVRRIGVLPCSLTADGLVHPHRLTSIQGNQVVSYLQKCNATQRLNGHFTPEGSETLAGFDTLQLVPNERPTNRGVRE